MRRHMTNLFLVLAPGVQLRRVLLYRMTDGLGAICAVKLCTD